MAITLRLPQPDVPIEIGQASFRASRLAQTLAMAFALHQRGEQRPHWLDEALREINEISELLKLEAVTVADPVDALFDRANVVALSRPGQVLR